MQVLPPIGAFCNVMHAPGDCLSRHDHVNIGNNAILCSPYQSPASTASLDQPAGLSVVTVPRRNDDIMHQDC